MRKGCTSFGDVYLLHIEPPYKHAAHYLGFAEVGNLAARIREHSEGQGARLCAVAIAAGCKLIPAKVWPNTNRKFERRMKKRDYGSIFDICPICKERNAGNVRGDAGAPRLQEARGAEAAKGKEAEAAPFSEQD